MRKSWWFLSLALLGGGLVAVIVMGCATIMHGTSQSIGIGSSPTGATVFVDTQPQG